MRLCAFLFMCVFSALSLWGHCFQMVLYPIALLYGEDLQHHWMKCSLRPWQTPTVFSRWLWTVTVGPLSWWGLSKQCKHWMSRYIAQVLCQIFAGFFNHFLMTSSLFIHCRSFSGLLCSTRVRFPHAFKDTLYIMLRCAMFLTNSSLGITLMAQKYYYMSDNYFWHLS